MPEMDELEKFAHSVMGHWPVPSGNVWFENALKLSRELVRIHSEIRDRSALHSLDEYHTDDGNVLWWKFPITEAPYVGSPSSSNWPGYHTHWSRITIPEQPKEFKKK